MTKDRQRKTAFLPPPYSVDPNEEGTIQSADRAPFRIIEAVKKIKGRKGPGDAR